ncbi:hypothetical protein Peur_008679 [Populus x canadensis]
MGGSRTLVHGIASRLSIKGFTAITFDMRSVGRSTGVFLMVLLKFRCRCCSYSGLLKVASKQDFEVKAAQHKVAAERMAKSQSHRLGHTGPSVAGDLIVGALFVLPFVLSYNSLGIVSQLTGHFRAGTAHAFHVDWKSQFQTCTSVLLCVLSLPIKQCSSSTTDRSNDGAIPGKSAFTVDAADDKGYG